MIDIRYTKQAVKTLLTHVFGTCCRIN